MTSKIAVIDYGMGNLNSIKKVFDRLKSESVITSKPEDVIRCQKIILPGVGHFGKAMENLKKLGLTDVLHEAVLTDKKPILGICLGMQLLAKKSAEGNSEGLGWLDAEVVKFDVSDRLKYKIPQMGWNRIFIKKESSLMNLIPDGAEFYFVHSYHWRAGEKSDVLCETNFDYDFPSAVENGNIFGVQFHPEKSHDAGIRLLKNFIEL